MPVKLLLNILFMLHLLGGFCCHESVMLAVIIRGRRHHASCYVMKSMVGIWGR